MAMETSDFFDSDSVELMTPAYDSDFLFSLGSKALTTPSLMKTSLNGILP